MCQGYTVKLGRKFIVLLMVFIVSGCKTDKPVFFKDSILSEQELTSMIGHYHVPGNDDQPTTLSISSSNEPFNLDGKTMTHGLNFSMKVAEHSKINEVSGFIVLSRIPKTDVVLGTIPINRLTVILNEPADEDFKNSPYAAFGILKLDEEHITEYHWNFNDPRLDEYFDDEYSKGENLYPAEKFKEFLKGNDIFSYTLEKRRFKKSTEEEKQKVEEQFSLYLQKNKLK